MTPSRGAARAGGALVLCSGKVSVDLLESPQRRRAGDVAVARVEQLYPFPAEEVQACVDGYPRLRRGRLGAGGAREHGRVDLRPPLLARLCQGGVTLQVVARPASGSPSEGSASRHAATQQALVAAAFALEPAAEAARKPTRRR